MPRASRYFLPNHIWHITHRCHQRDFLLKFARDRRRWRQSARGILRAGWQGHFCDIVFLIWRIV
jgi:REP element-mobilizing transposase RayT